MNPRLVFVFCCIALHLKLVTCYRAVKTDPVAVIKTFRRGTAASNRAPKSPLLEIVLRILDTIQIVPKKRSRRQEQSQTVPGAEDDVPRGLFPLPPLFGSAILGGREEKPLLAMSLESGEADTEQATSSVDRIDDEEDEFYPLKGYHLRRITSSKRFYATVLGVLQVLESQARQKVLRAREQQENVRSAYGEEDKQPA